MIWLDEEDDPRNDPDYEEEDDASYEGYTVSLKGAPNMATVQWVGTEREAIERTAREWGVKPEDCYIYKGKSL